ncbi:MAG: ADOP family duplicated permease [Phycisphaerales bacterium]
MTDLKYGVRMLIKKPGFSAVTVSIFAIGIGINTVMFGIVNALMFRPVNVREPESLVLCEPTGRLVASVQFSLFEEIQRNNPVFTEVSGFSSSGCVLRVRNTSSHVERMFVSSNYFSMLGVTQMRGRGFLPAEDGFGAGCVGVLSHHAWLHLGADAGIIGEVAFIDGYPCRIVGIAPKDFTGGTLVSPSIWLPLGAYYGMRPAPKEPAKTPIDFKYPWGLRLIGRLKAGLSRPTAEACLEPLSVHLRKVFPSDWKAINQFRLKPLPRIHVSIRNEYAMLSIICVSLMAAGAAVLGIVCLNLANMILVQGASRHREIAIRSALGGSRLRIVRQILAELLLLAVLGGALGLLCAYGSIGVLNASIARPKYFQGMQIRLDLTVLMATLGFCLLATVLAGLWPALRLSRHDLMASMKESRTGISQATPSTARIIPRGVSVASQIALATILVMGAALFTRSALRAVHVDPGYDVAGKLIVGLDCRVDGGDGNQCRQLYGRLMDHLRTVPGVRAIGLSEELPLDGLASADVQMADSETDDDAGMRHGIIESAKQDIGGDYFQAIGLGLSQGRYFTHEESITAAKVAIVNDTLARKLRPDGNVLGWRLRGGHEIVGIAPTVRHSLFRERPEPQVYFPLRESAGQAFLVVRVVDEMVGNEGTLLGRLRQEIYSVNPNIPIFSMETLSEFHRSRLNVWSARLMAQLSLAFGAVASFLAALGIYGVKGYMVATRTAEFGIRMALGATRRDILTMVMRDRLILTLAGMGFGVCTTAAAACVIGDRVLANILCDLSPIDPVSIAVTIVLVGLVTVAAGYIPARRAAKVDPMETLRQG